MHGYCGGPMGFGWMGGLFVLIFWALVIICVFWFLKHMIRSGDSMVNHTDTPLEILNKRYAKGEIDKKEYEEKKKDLVT